MLGSPANAHEFILHSEDIPFESQLRKLFKRKCHTLMLIDKEHGDLTSETEMRSSGGCL
jgi:hypothetical protein